MAIARTERRELCALLDEVGPDAPTLCEGWRTRDLAAHLVIRERRLDAAPGMLLRPLAGHTARVQQGLAERPWQQLVALVRNGPPRWSPFGLPGVDAKVNAGEYFVHHEDVRRARAGWEPRASDPGRNAALWRMLSPVARLGYRGSSVGVTLRSDTGVEMVAKQGPRTVTVRGEPTELLLHAFGRDEVRLDFDGEQDAVAVVRGLRRGF